jgi:hypothetical protein
VRRQVVWVGAVLRTSLKKQVIPQQTVRYRCFFAPSHRHCTPLVCFHRRMAEKVFNKFAPESHQVRWPPFPCVPPLAVLLVTSIQLSCILHVYTVPVSCICSIGWFNRRLSSSSPCMPVWACISLARRRPSPQPRLRRTTTGTMGARVCPP